MNAISWFEIPVTNIERAQNFYETIFGIKMVNMDTQNLSMRVFPVNEMMKNVSGSLIFNKDFYTPSSNQGVLVYLNANPDLQKVLDKIEAAGGKIFIPKTKINDEFGYMAIIMDSEGNRIGIQSAS